MTGEGRERKLGKIDRRGGRENPFKLIWQAAPYTSLQNPLNGFYKPHCHRTCQGVQKALKLEDLNAF